MAITDSEARKNLFPLIEKVNEDRIPIAITSRRGRCRRLDVTGRLRRPARNGSSPSRTRERSAPVGELGAGARCVGDDLVILQARFHDD